MSKLAHNNRGPLHRRGVVESCIVVGTSAGLAQKVVLKQAPFIVASEVAQSEPLSHPQVIIAVV